MRSLRVFVSYDLDHDEDLFELLVGRSRHRDSAFEIVGCSQPGEMGERWSEGVRRQLGAVDEVIVICGEHSETSPRMSAELGIVRGGKKPYFLLWGRHGCMCTKPTGARSADGIFGWTQENVEAQMRLTARSVRAREAAERRRA